jgi:uncharacterized protein (UPF0335 family)
MKTKLKPVEAVMDSTERLKQFVSRIERLEDERDARALDIREVYSEVKAQGFDVKVLRKLIKLKKASAEKLAEEKSLLETYASALQLDFVF